LEKHSSKCSQNTTGDIDSSYPVTPIFSVWTFPHKNLPPSWPSSVPFIPATTKSDITSALGQRDSFKCQMSASTEAYEKAHILPVQENEWFHANRMDAYIFNKRWVGTRGVNDVNNMLLLRADLHTLFDEYKFVFIPKKEISSSSGKFVSHMLTHSRELSQLYHNVQLQSSEKLKPQFLLARLAFSVLPMMEGFLQGNLARKLYTVTGDSYTASAEECKNFTSTTGARSRNVSPQKSSSPKRTHDQMQQSGGLEGQGTPCDSQPKRTRTAPQDDPMTNINSIPSSPTANTPSHSVDHRLHRRPNCELLSTGDSGTTLPSTSPPRLSLPPPPASPPASPDTRSSLTAIWAEDDHYNVLRERALEQERKRSDPKGSWDKELEWASQELASAKCEPGGMEKVYEIMGYEFRDAELQA
jgi:hypothetical protein